MIPIGFLALVFGTDLTLHEEIETHDVYGPMIGQVYKTKSEYLIYGVNMDDPIGADIDKWKIGRYPGVAGREIIASEKLPENSMLTIVKMARCMNCNILGLIHREDIEIGIMLESNIEQKTVWISDSFASDVFLVSEEVRLNPEYFELVK